MADSDAGLQVAGVVGIGGNIVRLRVLELAHGQEIYDDSFEVSLAVPALISAPCTVH